MNTITKTFAANVTYSGNTFNTKLIITYKHTGKQFFTKKKKQGYNTCTTNIDIANQWKDKGLIVTENEGYYFMYRLAIPNINANGKDDIWYINNDGDNYRVNQISKYGRKVHHQLSQPQKAIN